MVRKLDGGTYARASWNALSTRSTSASGPPRYSSTLFCGGKQAARWDQNKVHGLRAAGTHDEEGFWDATWVFLVLYDGGRCYR